MQGLLAYGAMGGAYTLLELACSDVSDRLVFSAAEESLENVVSVETEPLGCV